MEDNKYIEVGEKKIGLDHPTYFIADIAANFDGSIERAKDLIYLAAEAGADAAKFQNFKADTIVSAASFNAMESQLSHQASWEDSVYEVYEKASLPIKWTIELKETCDDAGIHYFTTPYEMSFVNKLKEHVVGWKLGSGDITWHDHIEAMAKIDMPFFIATGASSLEEVKAALEVAQRHTKKIILMQCNTNYTAELENFKFIALNVLKLYGRLFPETILGLSDHTPGHSTVLGSVTLGARAVEKHFTDDNDRVGPDHKFSMNPLSWREMVDRTRELELALGNEEKCVMANEKDSAVVQRRSIHVNKDIAVGDIIKEEDIIMLRPELEGSFPPYMKDNVIGKKAKKAIKDNTAIKHSDI